MNGDHTPPLCSNEHAQFTRLTWSETIERPEEIYFLESEVAPEVERLVKHKAALLQLAREGLQIQSAASLVMWQKRLEFCIANEPTPPQPASNDLSYIQEVQHHCDRIIWRGRYYHLENMRPADEIESLRAMIRVKDKDYQALRAAHDSLSFETNDTAAVQAIETGVMQPPNLASHFTSMDPGDLPPVSERDIAAMQAVINALYRHKSRQPIATREQIDLVRTMCNPIIGRRDGSDAAIEAVCVSAEIVQATLDGASALKANEGQS